MGSVQVKYKSIWGARYCKEGRFRSLLSSGSGVRIPDGSPKKSLEPQRFEGFSLSTVPPSGREKRDTTARFFRPDKSKYKSTGGPPPRNRGPPDRHEDLQTKNEGDHHANQ